MTESRTQGPPLKLKTARTLKWNTVDRVSSQVIYAAVGVVLANLLTKEDFGLVGALLVFQAFGILFVDSGFGTALLQKKEPDKTDYSTVFWFNLVVSIVIYAILFLCAPLIAYIFQGDHRLIPLSRVMFLSFILNGLGLVQTTRLMKTMDVKQIAIANIIGLSISGTIGITIALKGGGAWALVWQTVSLSASKSAWLWITGNWLPRIEFSLNTLRQIWRVGLSVFSSSALNTFFLYIYSFIIGAFYNLTALGVYTQADKWSKMGSASISQILTASFVPLLAKFQDDGPNFRRYVSKINKFSAFILFPVMIGLASIGAPLFHTLFGNKWDSAIILFQILTIRGIFVILISLYNNYLLSLGFARKIFIVEVIKDVLIFVAILSTIWFGSVPILVCGQLAASIITYTIVLNLTSKSIGIRIKNMVKDMLPFAIPAVAMGMVISMIPALPTLLGTTDFTPTMRPIFQLIIMLASGILIYIGLLHMTRRPELSETANYVFGRFKAPLNKKNHKE